MRVKRFIYVRSPSGSRLHRIYKTRYNPVEGDKTACGVPVTTQWSVADGADKAVKRRCVRCENVSG